MYKQEPKSSWEFCRTAHKEKKISDLHVVIQKKELDSPLEFCFQKWNLLYLQRITAGQLELFCLFTFLYDEN